MPRSPSLALLSMLLVMPAVAQASPPAGQVRADVPVLPFASPVSAPFGEAGALPRMRPYDGFAMGDDLPAVSTEIHAQVSGLYALIEIRRRFANPSGEEVGGPVAFYLPHGAALLDLAMRAGDVRVWSRQTPGRSPPSRPPIRLFREPAASETVPAWPGAFVSSLRPIAPGAEGELRLRYGLPLIPEPKGRRFTLRLPTRAETVQCGADACPARPVETRVVVDAGLPIEAWSTPGHAAKGEIVDGRLTVTLGDHDRQDDRDLVLHYTVAGDGLDVGAVVHRAEKGQGGGLFAGLPRLPAETRTGDETAHDHVALVLYPPTEAPVPSPREVLLVVDISRSMTEWHEFLGEPLFDAILRRLGPEDTFDVVVFGLGSARLFESPQPVTAASIAAAERWLWGVKYAGGGPVARPVERFLHAPPTPGRDRHVVMLTDGRVPDPAALIEAARAHVAAQQTAGLDGRVFVFGDGAGGRCTRASMAVGGRGESFEPGASSMEESASPSSRLVRDVERLFRQIERPVLTDVTVDWGALEGESPPPIDLRAGRPVMIHRRLTAPAGGRVGVRGLGGGSAIEVERQTPVPNPGLAPAWATAQVLAGLGDHLDARVSGRVLALARRYGVPSPYSVIRSFNSAYNLGRNPSGVGPNRSPADVFHWAVPTGFDDEAAYDPDRDGKIDRVDRCPDDPEDYDTVEDEDGCPDPGPRYDQPDEDADGDGVVDLHDACPLHQENLNGLEDADGCPESPVRSGGGDAFRRYRPRNRFGFAPGTARLTGGSVKALDEVVQYLTALNGIDRMRVEGHTDDRGPMAANQRLSERRAQAVVDELVKRGIDPGRLEAVGFGEVRRVASNDTVKGRALNRRIEFRIVEHHVKVALMPQLVRLPRGARRAMPLPPSPPPPPPPHEVACPGSWVSGVAVSPAARAEFVDPVSGMDASWRVATRAGATACYRLALTRSPALAGETTLRFGSGPVQWVEGVDDARLVSCLSERVTTPPGGAVELRLRWVPGP